VSGRLLSRLSRQPTAGADTLRWLWSLVAASRDYTVAAAAAAALSALLGTRPTYVLCVAAASLTPCASWESCHGLHITPLRMRDVKEISTTVCGWLPSAFPC